MKKVKYVLMAMMAAALLVLCPKTADAARIDGFLVKQGITYKDKSLCFAGSKEMVREQFFTVKGLKNLKLTSSDESVCKISKYRNKDVNEDFLKFEYLRPGKAVLKVSYKYKGKTYKSRARIKVVDFQNPLSSFKIGNTDYAYIFDGKPFLTAGNRISFLTKETGKKAIVPRFKSGYKMIRGNYQFKRLKVDNNYKKKRKVNLSKLELAAFDYKDKQGYKARIIWCNENPL